MGLGMDPDDRPETDPSLQPPLFPREDRPLSGPLSRWPQRRRVWASSADRWRSPASSGARGPRTSCLVLLHCISPPPSGGKPSPGSPAEGAPGSAPMLPAGLGNGLQRVQTGPTHAERGEQALTHLCTGVPRSSGQAGPEHAGRRSLGHPPSPLIISVFLDHECPGQSGDAGQVVSSRGPPWTRL